MKTIFLMIASLVFSGNVWAQAGELYNARVNEDTSISDPANAMKAADGQWLAFRIPVLAGTHSPCCWKGKWNGMGESGCSLQKKHRSYGTRSDSPLAEHVIVFSKVRDGQVHDIRTVGETCPVNGEDARVTWIGNVELDAGLDWLESMAKSFSDESAAESALYALALHGNSDAGQRLYLLAKDGSNDISEEAIFWLGEARAEQGYAFLKTLLAELPRGDRRREINFALSLNKSPGAAELLLEISKSYPDPEQRGEAMFWLAEAYPQKAKSWLLEVIDNESDEDVLEQAVFAISQLPDGDGDKALLEIAKDNQASNAVRRQAIFWLAQSDNDSSVTALTELLTRQ